MSTKKERMQKAIDKITAEVIQGINSGERSKVLDELLGTALDDSAQDSTETIDQELIQMLKALTPEQTKTVKEFISKLKTAKN